MRDAEFVLIAKALADPTRRRMVDALRGAGELTCSDVCDQFPLSQPTISHHVRTLERAGLIAVREEGPFHVLTVNERALKDFATAVAGNVVDGVPNRRSARQAMPEGRASEKPSDRAATPRASGTPKAASSRKTKSRSNGRKTVAR